MQVKAGVDGIVPVGTTGESATVDYEEHIRIIALSVKFGGGKIKVIAGTGGNSTKEAIYLTQEAEKVGADGSLQVAPYYNKPTQEGLFQHFHAVARCTKLPIILYSIPGRCGIEIGVDTVNRLAHDSVNIVGIKEAGGNPDRVSQLRAALGHKFTILCGDDSLTLPFMAVGAQGVVSVASNVIPREVAHMVRAYSTGNTSLALKLHDKFYPLFKDLFIETNPGPVKAALAMMGMMDDEFRLPLVPISSASREKAAENDEGVWSSEMTRVIITGAKGRMGKALIACAPQHRDIEVVGQIDQGDDLTSVIGRGDVVIDFSSHTATPGIAGLCAKHGKALVVGTTGHSDEAKSQISNFKSQIPIVLSSNFSTGVNTLFWLTRKAAEILGPGYDLEVLEMHHRLKKDAPSGTAKSLAEILADVRKQQLARVARHGREGIVGERTAEEIGIHSVRGGDVVGDHTVIFAANGERVELTHKASSRDTFANGALRAAVWVAKQKSGLYDMQNVLGLT